jgi:integrase/recombinase XerD
MQRKGDIMTKALTIRTDSALTATADIMEDFAKFLRLHTADGDASPATIRSYYGNASQFVAWCAERGINPATATEDDIATYRRELVAQYEVGTVAVKLAAIRRLHEAAVWRGLRQDNPAAGLRAPKDRTERAERIKFLPLDGLRRILDAPRGNDPAAVHDRAMLALMGRHGLRVSEVAGLKFDAVDLDAGTVRVVGKGRKSRTVYLIESSAGALRQWLDIRESLANTGEPALFVSLDRAHKGGGMSTRAIRYVVDGYLADVGLKAKGISCHSLRHSVGTWSLAGGAKLAAIADLFGHSSTDTTRIYARIVDKMTENPAKFLEAMLTAQATV